MKKWQVIRDIDILLNVLIIALSHLDKTDGTVKTRF